MNERINERMNEYKWIGMRENLSSCSVLSASRNGPGKSEKPGIHPVISGEWPQILGPLSAPFPDTFSGGRIISRRAEIQDMTLIWDVTPEALD